MIPGEVFLVKGAGKHENRLASFELALRDAGIEGLNLVRVSSILPPSCKIVPKEEGINKLKPGEIVYCVLSRNESINEGEHITSAIGLAYLDDKKKHGYIWEHKTRGDKDPNASKYAAEMARKMLSSKHKIDIEPKTEGIQKMGVGGGNNWTTVLAAAVFVP
ncbi:MAG: arginine decarboxylase, pyruvoyl-dependent [Candidatus Altiarchaeales archaeon ex4484_96]|nr:MAG: arginine decarboxylase, pyruvoyl-dependent [Candidatus Altiarchaeales archaeon ex4484_96]